MRSFNPFSNTFAENILVVSVFIRRDDIINIIFLVHEILNLLNTYCHK